MEIIVEIHGLSYRLALVKIAGQFGIKVERWKAQAAFDRVSVFQLETTETIEAIRIFRSIAKLLEPTLMDEPSPWARQTPDPIMTELMGPLKDMLRKMGGKEDWEKGNED